jgi:hypothetical protein
MQHPDHLIAQFGFGADPDKTTKDNLISLVENMKASDYFNRPLNRRLQNLLEHRQPSGRLTSILGMGLNFCIRESHPTNHKRYTFDQLRRDIRRINFWLEQETDKSKYNPKLYLSQGK